MPPLLIAFLEVASLFAAFWMTRAIPSKGRKWGLRVASFIVLSILTAALAEDARASATAGEYSVYLGIPAVVIYRIAKKRAGAAVLADRRSGAGRSSGRR